MNDSSSGSSHGSFNKDIARVLIEFLIAFVLVSSACPQEFEGIGCGGRDKF